MIKLRPAINSTSSVYDIGEAATVYLTVSYGYSLSPHSTVTVCILQHKDRGTVTYSKTSEQRTHWGGAICPLWRGCPLLGGFLLRWR